MDSKHNSMKHRTAYLTLARARRGRKGPRCWRPDTAGIPCFEEPLAMRNRAAWLREYPGLQRAADGYPCLGLLLKNHRRGCRRDYARTHSNGTPCFLEGADHVSLWRAGGRVACYVFQPYHVGAEMEKRLASLADEHGFHIVIRGTEESFWFAGSTSIIEVWHNRETCEAARSAIMTV